MYCDQEFPSFLFWLCDTHELFDLCMFIIEENSFSVIYECSFVKISIILTMWGVNVSTIKDE